MYRCLSGWKVGDIAVLYRAFGEDLSDKVSFEQRVGMYF